MASYLTIEQISRYCPTVLPVTDDGFRPLNGPVANGVWDWHVAGCAVDYANNSSADMRDFAQWWYQWAGYLIELIHTTPFNTDNGYYVKNGVKVGESFYGYQTNISHMNHVHVAMTDAKANALLSYLQGKYGPPGKPQSAVSTPPAAPPQPLTSAQQAYNAGFLAAWNPAFKIGFNAGYLA